MRLLIRNACVCSILWLPQLACALPCSLCACWSRSIPHQMALMALVPRLVASMGAHRDNVAIVEQGVGVMRALSSTDAHRVRTRHSFER